MIIKILIADDHRVVRQGLRTMIAANSNMEVVGEAQNGREAIELTDKLKPNIVIMDLTMPILNGIEATRQITKDHPEIKVIALSMHSGKQFVSSMLKAGACGYLLKNCAFDELSQALNLVVQNQVYLSPGIAHVVVQDYTNKISDQSTTICPGLSDREREVLQLIAEGWSTKQIASNLHVSGKTVSTHREHIMHKLNIHNIVDLAKYAIKEGLTTIDV